MHPTGAYAAPFSSVIRTPPEGLSVTTVAIYVVLMGWRVLRRRACQ